MVLTNLINSSAPSGRALELQPPRTTYRGRVRTGCLVCRSRKVKCDEQRPSCQRCMVSKRKCAYKHTMPPMPLKPMPPNMDSQQYQSNNDSSPKEPPISSQQNHLINGHIFSHESISNTRDSQNLNTSKDIAQPSQSFSASVDVAVPSSNNNEVNSFHQGDDLNNADSPSARFYTTSLQLYVTTTLDWLGICGPQSQPFAYFIEEVDSPVLSSFDYLNWKKIKLHVTQLATQDESVAAAILAVQNVYRAQVNRLPMLHATSECEITLATFEFMVASDAINFDTILVVVFLLCLCEVTLPNVDGPAFRGFNGAFETRLTAWLLCTNRSPVSLRICTWLQLLHIFTKRSGCCGLLPETTFDLLSSYIPEVPALPPLDNNYSDSASAMYDILSAPIFAFYLELQRISNQIQDLCHYRRSRITPADQAEVTDIVKSLNSMLFTLWNNRPSPLRYQPSQLRENFCRRIAEPLIAFAGVCIASYFGEVVGLRRTLGDNPFPSTESEQAMRQIRDIIEGEWNVLNDGMLNPGYIRPLFLYSIETMQQDETQWAVDCLRQVKSPISRSEFIASLGESLGRAQRMEKRRVATKYFCTSTFKVMVPRM